MANLLQRVIIAFSFVLVMQAAPATGRPFSHKLHLKLKPTCVSCHQTVPTSTKAEDNNLPRPEVCLPCHQTVEIKQPASLSVSKFNHQLHGRMGNLAPLFASAIDKKTYLSKPGDARRHLASKNACVACHRGMEESESLLAKTAFPAMADCLVCHTKIDPPFSCETCHDAKAELRPSNHLADFLDSHNRKNHTWDKDTCAVCHGVRFTCLGCH